MDITKTQFILKLSAAKGCYDLSKDISLEYTVHANINEEDIVCRQSRFCHEGVVYMNPDCISIHIKKIILNLCSCAK